MKLLDKIIKGTQLDLKKKTLKKSLALRNFWVQLQLSP